MKFNFEFYQEGPNQCMVRRRSHDDYNGCGMFSVSEEFGAEICKRWNGYAAMTAAKNRAVEALKQTRKSIGEWLHDEWDGEDGWNAITGRLSQAIAELEEVK